MEYKWKENTAPNLIENLKKQIKWIIHESNLFIMFDNNSNLFD